MDRSKNESGRHSFPSGGLRFMRDGGVDVLAPQPPTGQRVVTANFVFSDGEAFNLARQVAAQPAEANPGPRGSWRKNFRAQIHRTAKSFTAKHAKHTKNSEQNFESGKQETRNGPCGGWDTTSHAHQPILCANDPMPRIITPGASI